MTRIPLNTSTFGDEEINAILDSFEIKPGHDGRQCQASEEAL